MFNFSTNKVNLNPVKQRYKQTIDRLPVKLGAKAIEYVSNNFRAQGFVDKGVSKWPARKNNTDPGRAILVGKGSGHLRRSIRVIRYGRGYVAVGSQLEYATIHNQGGIIDHPGGTPYFIKDGMPVWVSRKKAAEIEAASKRVLRRTGRHAIKIPRRQFMPTTQRPSATLNKQLSDLVKSEIRKI